MNYSRNILGQVKERARANRNKVIEPGLILDVEQICDQLAATMPPRWLVSYEVEAGDAVAARWADVPDPELRSARPNQGER